jgi:DNA-binding CsgD family transcriptional regulator
MNGLLDGFLSRLNASGSVQQTWDELLAFQQSLGFDLIMYGYTCSDPTQSETKTEIATLSNFPRDYQLYYHQKRYYRYDPLVSHCIANLSPLLVGCEAVSSWPDGGWTLTPIQRRIINDAAECGMRMGVVIPLRSPGCHPLAGMSLSNAMPRKAFQQIWAEWGMVAQLAAVYAHTQMQILLQRGKEEKQDVTLTDRERECLLWASCGLSSKQTANRLSVSSRTVDFHVANAMKKLKTTSRIQAVARAVTLGLVMP